MGIPKRIVISRKGFDSGTGCIPSPIFEDGTMLSLPIPDSAGTVSYADLTMNGHSYGKLISDLGGMKQSKDGMKRLSADDKVHLDPDLLRSVCQRRAGWRPSYGQCDSSLTILQKHEIGRGDLFLFYGWFRYCELIGGRYQYVKKEPDLHVIFGYLKVDEMIRISNDPVPTWAMDHPHLTDTARKKDNNMLFVGADSLGIEGAEDLPGAAAFHKFKKIDDREESALQLTAPGKSRSWWRLPKWIYPRLGVPTLSSHERAERWKSEGEFCLMQNVSRGQEFVLDVQYYPESIEWVRNIINQGVGDGRRLLKGYEGDMH